MKRQGKIPPKPAAKKRVLAWIQQGEWIAASLLALGALFLHATFVTHVGALWRDEVNSFDFASMPLGQAHALLRYDSFPLLTTVLLRGWIHAAGGADPALRVYGLIVGVLFLAALFFAGRALGGGPPLVSLALVGMNPWIVRTVDSIRPYGWGIVLITAALGCAWSAVRTQKPAWLILTAAAAVASVQCMYQNAFLLAAILLAGAFTAWRASDRKTALGLLGAGALAAASLFVYLPGIRAAGEWGMLIRAHIPVSRIVKVLAGTVDAGGPVYVGLWIALVVLALVIGVLALRRKGPDAAVFSAVALVLAGSAYLGAILATQVQTEPWYYVPLIAVAGPLLEAALRGRWRIARLALCLGAGAFLLVPAAAFVKVRWTSVDVVAAKVEAAAAPGDLVVLSVLDRDHVPAVLPWQSSLGQRAADEGPHDRALRLVQGGDGQTLCRAARPRRHDPDPPERPSGLLGGGHELGSRRAAGARAPSGAPAGERLVPGPLPHGVGT